MKSIRIRKSIFDKFYSTSDSFGDQFKKVGYLHWNVFNYINFEVFVRILPGASFVECSHDRTKLTIRGFLS
jgi:hypothetical protein